MSFDVFLQGFGQSLDSTSTAQVLQVINSHLSGDGNSIVNGDSRCDVFGHRDDPLSGLMLNHLDGDDIFVLIYTIAITADWVVLPVGGPTIIVREAQRAALPDELLDDVALAASTSELRTAALS